VTHPPLVRLALGLYAFGVELVVWCVLAPLAALRATLGGGSWSELRARLGSAREAPASDASASRGPLVWIHAVSVGELAAAEALLIDGALPGGWLEPAAVRVELSTGTPEGLRFAELIATRHRRVVGVRLLPWDRPRVLRRVFGAAAPAVVVVVETELWPGLLSVCARLAIPVELASARIPPHEVWRYRLGRWLFGPLLAGVAGIGAQTDAERRRLIAIGAPPERVVVHGNLKADRLAVAVSRAEPPAPVVVLGASTHRSDERVLVTAVKRVLARGLDLRLVLAPRHPRRAAGVARRARVLADGAAPSGAVEVGPDPAHPIRAGVTVVDRLGALDALYDRAHVVVVGGGFGRRGGQDPLAAAARGCPVVVGPRHPHVEESVALLRSAGGLTVARDARELADQLERLIVDDAARRAAGERAAKAVAGLRGAARRAGESLARHLQEPAGAG
jgi:3-deoxy-D-manno-octulosonic-acid transferase